MTALVIKKTFEPKNINAIVNVESKVWLQYILLIHDCIHTNCDHRNYTAECSRTDLSLEKPKATLDVHAFSTQDTKSINFIMFV